MKIVTWNVNSIRVRLERAKALLQRLQPDVLALQELKSAEETYPGAEFEALDYHSVIHGQKTYNGVALLSPQPAQEVLRGFPGDPIPEQSRVIVGDFNGVRVINLYVVNGKSVGTPHYETKLAWLDALQKWLEETQDPKRPLVILGDFNIAPDDRDVHDPEKWKDKVHCSTPERERLQRMYDWGLVDLFREHHEEDGLFSWWDYRMGAFHRGWGLRIDLILGTAPVVERCTSVEIEREERKASSGEGKASDHAPVIAVLQD